MFQFSFTKQNLQSIIKLQYHTVQQKSSCFAKFYTTKNWQNPSPIVSSMSELFLPQTHSYYSIKTATKGLKSRFSRQQSDRLNMPGGRKQFIQTLKTPALPVDNPVVSEITECHHLTACCHFWHIGRSVGGLRSCPARPPRHSATRYNSHCYLSPKEKGISRTAVAVLWLIPCAPCSKNGW